MSLERLINLTIFLLKRSAVLGQRRLFWLYVSLNVIYVLNIVLRYARDKGVLKLFGNPCCFHSA